MKSYTKNSRSSSPSVKLLQRCARCVKKEPKTELYRVNSRTITNLLLLLFIAGISSCKMEYKHTENDVQGYNWIGMNGNEEIKNDTIYTYNKKIGDSDFTYRIIKEVTDSVIAYQDYDNKTGKLIQHTATYQQKITNEIPYLIVYYEASVSMFTRKKVCPINFKNIF